MAQTLFRTSMLLASALWLAACGAKGSEGLGDAGVIHSDAGADSGGSAGLKAPQHDRLAEGEALSRAERILRRFAAPEPAADDEAADVRAPQSSPRPQRAPARQAQATESGASPCTMLDVQITPDLSPTDQCTIPFTCTTGARLEVQCDGENDGTFTSLCSCYIDGALVSLDGLFAGEAPDSCFAAVDKCLQRLR